MTLPENTKVAVLGTGTMGRALGQGLIESSSIEASHLQGTIRHDARLTSLRDRVDFEVGTDNVAAAKGADIVMICTKPVRVREVVAEISAGGALDHNPLIVSIAAGVRTAEIEAAAARECHVVRAMPNTPCLIGEGMTVICSGKHADDSHLDLAQKLFEPLGRVLRLDEDHMDTVTGLSGSGPAFVYVIIEALSEGGVMMGLPRQVATELASQTVKGAARMVLETGRHPASLKGDVLTPAGCTISALLAMEDGRLRSVLARGVQEAARTAAQLGEQSAT